MLSFVKGKDHDGDYYLAKKGRYIFEIYPHEESFQLIVKDRVKLRTYNVDKVFHELDDAMQHCAKWLMKIG